MGLLNQASSLTTALLNPASLFTGGTKNGSGSSRNQAFYAGSSSGGPATGTPAARAVPNSYYETASSLAPFLAGNPSTSDILARNFSLYQPVWNTKSGPAMSGAAGTGALINRIYGGPAQQVGLSSLTSMLLNEGRTPPGQLQQEVGDISRGTASAQQGAAGSLAAGGWDNLGLGKALQAAIGQAGENRTAARYAAEDQAAYQRQQQNLQQLGNLVIGPSQGYGNIGAGLQVAGQQQQSQNTAAGVAALGALLAAFA